jgi:hypothetical protein
MVRVLDRSDWLMLLAASALIALSSVMLGCAADVAVFRQKSPVATAATLPAEQDDKPSIEDLVGGVLTATTRLTADPGVRGAAELSPWGNLVLTLVGGTAAGGLAVLGQMRANRRASPKKKR